jgi:hypothetical protein
LRIQHSASSAFCIALAGDTGHVPGWVNHLTCAEFASRWSEQGFRLRHQVFLQPLREAEWLDGVDPASSTKLLASQAAADYGENLLFFELP